MKIKFGERIIISDSDKLTPRSEDEVLKEIAFKGSYNFWVEPVEVFDNAVTEAIIKIAKERGIDEVVLLNKPAIISALEKQIPKKPIVHLEKNYEGDICDASYSCPICSRTICFEVEGNLAENYPYCNCGQKLDWGDGE